MIITKKAVILTAIFLSTSLIFSAVFMLWANYTIENVTAEKVYDSVDDMPFNKVGIVLGTSKTLKSGVSNPYFDNRIKAAVELYGAGKIGYIIVSGDNGEKNYNEPQDMKDDLVAHGVSSDKIFLDYAGFRTLDSVVRLKEIFGQSQFTVISQKFHNQRAIYIAKMRGLQAVGYNAKDVGDGLRVGFLTKVRERFARIKVFIDLAFGKEPKYLGEPIIIE